MGGGQLDAVEAGEARIHQQAVLETRVDAEVDTRPGRQIDLCADEGREGAHGAG